MPQDAARVVALLLLTGGALSCGSQDQAQSSYEQVSPASDAGPIRDAADIEERPAPKDAAPHSDAPSGPDTGPPYPIVLHHGFCGWKELQSLNLRYFYGIPEDLAVHGETQVYETSVEPFAATDVRAGQLAVLVDEVLRLTGKDKVNLIAHSQGGLDSRYLISTLGYGDRVASLTTISTPHRGTRVADAALRWVPDWTDPLLNSVADIIGGNILDFDSNSDVRASIESLSEYYVRNIFNPENPNDPQVDYYSYAGRSNDSPGVADCEGSQLGNDPTRVDHIHPLLSLTGGYLKKPGVGVHCENDTCANDGMVTVESARWGLFMGCFPADHFNEIGQIKMDQPVPESGFDQKVFYRQVVERLRTRGY